LRTAASCSSSALSRRATGWLTRTISPSETIRSSTRPAVLKLSSASVTSMLPDTRTMSLVFPARVRKNASATATAMAPTPIGTTSLLPLSSFPFLISGSPK